VWPDPSHPKEARGKNRSLRHSTRRTIRLLKGRGKGKKKGKKATLAIAQLARRKNASTNSSKEVRLL